MSTLYFTETRTFTEITLTLSDTPLSGGGYRASVDFIASRSGWKVPSSKRVRGKHGHGPVAGRRRRHGPPPGTMIRSYTGTQQHGHPSTYERDPGRPPGPYRQACSGPYSLRPPGCLTTLAKIRWPPEQVTVWSATLNANCCSFLSTHPDSSQSRVPYVQR